VVADAEGRHLWAFRIEADGRLTFGEPYYPLRVKPGQADAGVTALATDAAGRVYAATPLGVQVFDPTGRLAGVLLKPAAAPLTALTFGGKDLDTLYVACGDRIYARKTKAKGLAFRPQPAGERR
jgi:enterochelin esterase family protein